MGTGASPWFHRVLVLYGHTHLTVTLSTWREARGEREEEAEGKETGEGGGRDGGRGRGWEKTDSQPGMGRPPESGAQSQPQIRASAATRSRVHRSLEHLVRQGAFPDAPEQQLFFPNTLSGNPEPQLRLEWGLCG